MRDKIPPPRHAHPGICRRCYGNDGGHRVDCGVCLHNPVEDRRMKRARSPRADSERTFGIKTSEQLECFTHVPVNAV